MKFACLFFLGLSAFAQTDNLSLELQELNDAEREAGALCDFAVRRLKNRLEAKFAFDFSCNCNFRLFRPIEYKCNADVCFKNIKDLIDVDRPLPITDESCLKPVASGTLEKRSRDMTTKVCSGATSIVINVTQIEEQTGQALASNETVTIAIPNSCLEVEHNANSLTTYTGCAATVGGNSCPCTPCEGGKGVQVDCVDLIDPFIPPFLDPVLNYTEVCLYPGLYDNVGQQASDPLALGIFGLMVSMNV